MSTLVVVASLATVLASACPSDALFGPYDGEAPGASVAVIKNGTVVFEHAYGMANIATREKATVDTNFRLASITKQFTAMAIAILAERGQLSLDDAASRYLPELAVVAPAVTLRHLLTHTSGLPEYEALLVKDDPAQILDRDVLALIAKQPPAPAPGTFRYCNTGYALLALVVERVSKLAFAEFLQRNIFKPVGMTSTIAYDVKATIAHRAFGYTNRDGRFSDHDQTRSTAVLGDGGIYSSTRDLVHWIDALDRNALVGANRLTDATTTHVPTDVPSVGYGFGWRITEVGGEKLAFHGGTTSGFKNALLWVPGRRLAVIVLTNRRQGEPLLLAMMLLYQFWDTP